MSKLLRMDSSELPARNKQTDGVAFQGANRAPRNPIDFQVVTDDEEKKFSRGRTRIIRRTRPKPKMIEPAPGDALDVPELPGNPIPVLGEGR